MTTATEYSDIRKKTLKDFRERILEIKHILYSQNFYLDRFTKEIKRVKNHLIDEEYSTACQNALELKKILGKLNEETQFLLEKIKVDTQSKKSVNSVREKIYNLQRKIRITAQRSGALITSLDWQSPSFSHACNSEAGIQTAKISGTINDYKRDVHLDENFYEKEYLKKYIEAKMKLNLMSILTNSGQAAFITILAFLLTETDINEQKILIGKNVYFQYKQILQKSFKDKITQIEEHDNKNLIRTINENKFRFIFFDSLCNSQNINIPELKKIISDLNKTAKDKTYLVLDTTCTPLYLQPFNLINNKNIRLIIFESLNKYHQFGQDRVTSGIITCHKKEGVKIFEYRKHAGTNISDASVYALPIPNRILLEKTLNIHQRNALYLAHNLDEYIRNNNTNAEKIIYPGLKNHPAHEYAKKLGFYGSFFNIKFRKKWHKPKFIKSFITKTIKQAKKDNVRIIAGTSFGLNTTRIYLTSLWSKFGEPFLRVSCGTEDRENIENILRVFREVIG